jgi:hypothetical protein
MNIALYTNIIYYLLSHALSLQSVSQMRPQILLPKKKKGTWVVDVHDSGLEHVARAGDNVGADGALTKILEIQGNSTFTM